MLDKGQSRRRRAFPALKSWHLNNSGNWQIDLRRFRITVFFRPLGWGAVVSHPSRPDGLFTRDPCRSFAEAQLAAFDLFAALEAKIGRRG